MKAKANKIVGWTLGMAAAAYLIESDRAVQQALIGATIGLVLGFLFSRNLKAKSSAE